MIRRVRAWSLFIALPLVLGAGPVEKRLSPDLVKDGDLVFHSSSSSQSAAVALATKSRYTHMGIVWHDRGKPFVYEAVQPVKLTPLADWIARGKGGHVVVKRLKEREAKLTPEVVAAMQKLGKEWLGRPYDLQFRWDDERLYCSEIVYKLYERGAGVAIGHVAKAKDFDLSSPAVQRKMHERFGKGAAFDPEEIVISPQAMFDDPQLETVFENAAP